MRIAIYVRVSTEEQAKEGVSLAAQEAKLLQYCELFGHEPVAVFSDAGVSAKAWGKSLDDTLAVRPGLARMIQALESGEVEGVLIAKLDRLTRSGRDLNELLTRYFIQRFHLISMGESVDTNSAGGRLVLNVLISVAQWEREVIIERTRDAMSFKRAKGERLNGVVPYGWQVVEKRLARCTEGEEYETVKRMQAMRKAGQSLQEIADQLNDEGTYTRKGREWSRKTVNDVLLGMDS